jgi:hypothetical protein
MIDLVRKRHEGDGWLVFTELGNRPGYYANRFADAFALGVWASKKYEGHLYEIKTYREDLKRELRDPSKVEGVGKYAHYWWLVLESEAVMRDILIPDVWGVLVPVMRGNSRMLTVVKKATKHKPAPFDPKFAMAMVRNMAKNWVSPADHHRLQSQLDDVLAARDLKPLPKEAELEDKIHALERQLKELRDGVERFKTETGIDLAKDGPHGLRYMHGAFKVAQKIDRMLAEGSISHAIRRLSMASETMETEAKDLAQAAIALRGLTDRRECVANCRSKAGWGAGRCDCGANPLSEVERKLAADVRSSSGETAALASDRDDDQGSGGDSGHARSPEQDARV